MNVNHSGADATRYRREREPRLTKQIEQICSQPCYMTWSDGNQTETSLLQAFTTEEDYDRYKEYKRSGKPYPVKVEAKEMTEEELKSPSGVFIGETREAEYRIYKFMCDKFTSALNYFVEKGEEHGQ